MPIGQEGGIIIDLAIFLITALFSAFAWDETATGRIARMGTGKQTAVAENLAADAKAEVASAAVADRSTAPPKQRYFSRRAARTAVRQH